MIELVPYLKVNCDPACAEAGCDACGVEVNAWHAFMIQQASEQAGTPLIPDVPSSQIGCRCDEFEPAEPGTVPSSPITGGTFGWWYDPAVPVVSDRAVGFIGRSFTLQDPMSFSASRTEKLRDRVRLLPGLLLGELVVEVVGADVRSSKWLARQLKARLEGIPATCFTTLDVYADCCIAADGDTGLRRITTVSEFHVEELDGPGVSDWSTVVSVVFAADPNIESPDATVAAGAGVLLGDAGPLDCPNATTSVNFTEYTAKNLVRGDLELQPDGSLKLCMIDSATVNPATDFLKIRDVRAADAVTNPCSVEVDLDVTGAVPVVTPLQPDLWATQITGPLTATGEIDCTNQPIVRNLTVRNPNYKPDCPTCPDDARGRVCAEDAGLIINEFGIIDWTASGLDPAFEYVWTPGGGAPAALQKILNYWKCIGLTAASVASGPHGEGLDERGLWDLQGYFDDATHDDVIWSPDGSSNVNFDVDAIGVILQSSGEVYIKVGEELTPGVVTPTNVAYTIRVGGVLGFNGDNPFSTDTVRCGPGEAEHIGNVPYHVMFGAKLDLSAFYGMDISGDVNEISVPDLTVTPLFTPTGSPPAESMVYNPDLDEVWHIDLNPAASATLDLYENNVLVNTVTALDWGFDAAPFWDVAGGRMLVVLGGMNNSPQSRPDVRTDMVIAEWTTGGVFTEIHSWPLPLHPTPSILNRPIPFKAIATPNGGCFFALDKDADEPTTSGNNTLGYWSPATGFIFGIGPKLLDATGTLTGDTNLYFGATHAITPSGDFVWPYEDNPIETFWQINENDLATPPEDTVPVAPTVCTAELLTPADDGQAIPGTGFVKGLATLQADTAPFAIDVFLLNHAQPDPNPCGDTPDHCLPYISIPPAQSGPCVNITLSSNGSAQSDLSPLINDLSRARFEFGPCSTISTPDCPGIIPPAPVVTVDTVTGLATPVGWSPGYKWPADSEGSQYTVSEVDATPNDPTGIATVVARTVANVPVDCTAPCATPPILYTRTLESDCWTPSVAQTVDVFTITGLSKSTRYRPVWSVEAVDPMVQPQVFLWHGLSSDPAPTLGTVLDYVCSKQTPTRIKALEVGQVISYTAAGLRITCGTGTADALSDGWVDATDVWLDPEICGAEVAYLLVARTLLEAAPTVTFSVVPVGTP